MQPDVGRLVDEERERLVERRQLGGDLPQPLERAVAHPSRGGAVTDLVEVVRVGEDERAPAEVEHVELDQVDPCRDRSAERAQRVLRRERRGAAVPDPEHAVLRAAQLDHDAAAVGTETARARGGAATTRRRARRRPPARRRSPPRARRVLPEHLGVDAQQRVGLGEAPAVAAEEDLVEAEEEAVEAEQDHGDGECCDRRASRATRPAAQAARRAASARSGGARPRRRARRASTASWARNAAPRRSRTSCMWRSSRASKAGRSVRQGRAPEQGDPLAARLDRVEAGERELEPLRPPAARSGRSGSRRSRARAGRTSRARARGTRRRRRAA